MTRYPPRRNRDSEAAIPEPNNGADFGEWQIPIVEVVSIPERLGKTKTRDRTAELTNPQVAARCGVTL